MKNILIHGLGQNHKSWNETIKFLEIDNIDVLCPALFKMSSGNSNDYQNIFSSFSDFCTLFFCTFLFVFIMISFKC